MKTILLIILTFSVGCISALGQTEFDTYLENSSRLRSAGKTAEAIAELTKAINLQPNNADLYFERAVLHLLMPNKPELLADVQKAVSFDPTNKKMLYDGTLLVFKSGRYDKSLLLVNNLIALGSPDLATLNLNISVKTHLEDFAGAYQETVKALEMFPDDAGLKHNQANLTRLMGDSDTALEKFSAQIAALETKFNRKEFKDETERDRLMINLTELLYSRARIYQSKDDIEKMKFDLNKIIELQPISRNYERRAQYYSKQKMYSEAAADLTKAIETDSNQNIGLYMRRGDVYFSMLKYSEAIKDYEQVVKQKSGLEEFAARRIVSAKQKIQENNNQPK